MKSVVDSNLGSREDRNAKAIRGLTKSHFTASLPPSRLVGIARGQLFANSTWIYTRSWKLRKIPTSPSPLAYSRKENNISYRTIRENVKKIDNPNIDHVCDFERYICICIYFFLSLCLSHSLFLRKRNYDRGGSCRWKYREEGRARILNNIHRK